MSGVTGAGSVIRDARQDQSYCNQKPTTQERTEQSMKMLLDITLPHHAFNAAVKDGTVGSKLNRILEATKPEAVYFTEQNGQRGAVLVVELADLKLRVCMSSDDLNRAGLDELGKKWS
jgi:hypothetical protein